MECEQWEQELIITLQARCGLCPFPSSLLIMIVWLHCEPSSASCLSTTCLISERAKRASSVMFVFNRDFRCVRIHIYVCGRTSSYMRMLGGT